MSNRKTESTSSESTPSIKKKKSKPIKKKKSTSSESRSPIKKSSRKKVKIHIKKESTSSEESIDSKMVKLSLSSKSKSNKKKKDYSSEEEEEKHYQPREKTKKVKIDPKVYAKLKKELLALQKEKKKMGLKLLDKVQALIDKKKLNYIQFCAYIASRIYIKKMVKEGYTIHDLENYNLKFSLTEDVFILDIRSAIDEIYSVYAEPISEEKREALITKYKGKHFILLQKLYKKYVNSEFVINRDKTFYPGIIIVLY
jgi:hypothetical protein